MYNLPWLWTLAPHDIIPGPLWHLFQDFWLETLRMKKSWTPQNICGGTKVDNHGTVGILLRARCTYLSEDYFREVKYCEEWFRPDLRPTSFQCSTWIFCAVFFVCLKMPTFVLDLSKKFSMKLQPFWIEWKLYFWVSAEVAKSGFGTSFVRRR